MSFLEHLGELRKRIFRSSVAVVLAVIPAWLFSKDLYGILEKPILKYLPEGKQLVFTSLPAPFLLYLKVSFLAAVLFTSPYIFLQVWHFVAPGLYKKEQKAVVPFVLFSTIFFVAGAVFAYFVVFPFICRFFLTLGAEFEAMITVDQYFSLALRVILGLALVFELPTLVFFLSHMGVITAKFMIKSFKYAVLIAFIISAAITTPDIFTQSIVAIPLLALYGLSILIAMVVGKKRERKFRERDEAGDQEE